MRKFIKSSKNIGIDELEIINSCNELMTFLKNINELKQYEISIEYDLNGIIHLTIGNSNYSFYI